MNDSAYNRLARNANNALVVFFNKYNETFVSGRLVTLRKTKNRIKTRWETGASNNLSPFTHISLIVKSDTASSIIEIKPIMNLEYGFVDLEFDYDARSN